MSRDTMAQEPAQLHYAPTYTGTTLEETTGGFSFVVPPPPKWQQWLMPIGFALVALPATMMYVGWFRLLADLSDAATAARMCTILGLKAALCWALAVHSLLYLRAWGHVPTVLTLDDGRLILTKPGLWWGIRHKEWRVGSIRDIRLLPPRGRSSTVSTKTLRIRFQRGRPLRLRLKAEDPSLPQRVVQLLEQTTLPRADGMVASAHPTT